MRIVIDPGLCLHVDIQLMESEKEKVTVSREICEYSLLSTKF